MDEVILGAGATGHEKVKIALEEAKIGGRDGVRWDGGFHAWVLYSRDQWERYNLWITWPRYTT